MKRSTHVLIAASLLTLAIPTTFDLDGSAASAEDGDITSPRATWDFRNPDSHGWFNHDVGVAVDVTDETGLDVDRSRVWFTDVDSTIHGLDIPRTSLQLTVSANGVTEIDYSVFDLAGNEGAGEVLIYLDNLAPTLDTAGLPADGTLLDKDAVVPVGASCSDDLTGVDTSGIFSCGFTEGVVNGQVDTSTPGVITVIAQALDLAGNSTTVTRHYTVSGDVTQPVAARPRNIALPALFYPEGGRPISGKRVATTIGQWTGSPTTFAYQWLRSGVAIPGATDSSYVIQPIDVGAKLRVRVTATNTRGDGTARSRAVQIRR